MEHKKYGEFIVGRFVHSNVSSNLVLKTNDGRQVFGKPQHNGKLYDTLEKAKLKVESMRTEFCNCNYCITCYKTKSGKEKYSIVPSFYDSKAMDFYSGNWKEYVFKIKVIRNGVPVMVILSELTPEENENMDPRTIIERSYCYSY